MNLYDFARYAAGYFARWGFPCEVLFENDRVAAALREDYADRVVVSYDKTTGDQPVPITGAHRGRAFSQLLEGATIEVFARYNVEGARASEHQYLARIYRDAAICALVEWASVTRSPGVRVAGGRFLSRSERSDVEQWPGAVYQLRMVAPHLVAQARFEGTWKPETILQGSAITPTILSTKQAGTPDDPEE